MPKVIRKRAGVEQRALLQAISLQTRMRPHAWSPATDLFETETTYIIKVEIAGMRQDDFAVVYDKGQLIVSGVRVDPSPRRGFQQMEIRYGEFSTAVAIPGPIKPDEAIAEYEDGFLTVTLPKAQQHLISTEEE
jgi:HSP20 family protein